MHHLLDSVCVLYTNDLQIADSIKYYVASHLHVELRLPGEVIYKAGVFHMYHTHMKLQVDRYGVASMSRLLKIIGLFCRI